MAAAALVAGTAIQQTAEIPPPAHDLVFGRLAAAWDEGLPLGNGMLGALVWERDGRLRLSLDRADLWDLRPMPNLDSPEWSFRWVEERWRAQDYRAVQEKFDAPYENSPAPTKIPAGALEFDVGGFGDEEGARLAVDEAVGRVSWPRGKSFEVFVHAEKPCGRFRFHGAPVTLRPVLAAPAYGAPPAAGADSVTGQDLARLGYAQGTIIEKPGLIVYRQPGWGGFYYEVAVGWRTAGPGIIDGAWSVSSKFSDDRREPGAEAVVRQALGSDFRVSRAAHAGWWRAFWAKSGIELPDKVLEKQWYLEQYKFGAAARRGAPPISLQAVWTADNGKLPPGRAISTTTSTPSSATGRAIAETTSRRDWGSWTGFGTSGREFEAYTRGYFGTKRPERPRRLHPQGRSRWAAGSSTLLPDGRRLARPAFRLHWRFSRDRRFLKERAYPWVRDVAVFLDELSTRDADGRRKLPLSSSPEIFDNRREAWFAEDDELRPGLDPLDASRPRRRWPASSG